MRQEAVRFMAPFCLASSGFLYQTVTSTVCSFCHTVLRAANTCHGLWPIGWRLHSAVSELAWTLLSLCHPLLPSSRTAGRRKRELLMQLTFWNLRCPFRPPNLCTSHQTVLCIKLYVWNPRRRRIQVLACLLSKQANKLHFFPVLTNRLDTQFIKYSYIKLCLESVESCLCTEVSITHYKAHLR